MPDEINQLRQLRVLDLAANTLTTLPPIDALTELVVLNLEHNWLHDVPECYSCKQLRCLNLQNNHISQVPKNVASLPQLQELLLADNEIVAIHRSVLLQMPTLIVLVVMKTPYAANLRGLMLPSGFPII